MISIFLSYRRADTSGHAGRLYDHLSTYFGCDRIFYDRNSIREGSLWESKIESALTDCRTVLALIGRDWAEDVNRQDSFVRRELRLAIARNLTIFPVLVPGMAPPINGLPEDLSRLNSYQAVVLPENDLLYQEAIRQLCLSISLLINEEGGIFRRHLKEGLRLMEEREYGDALAELKAAAQDNSIAPEALLYMALATLSGRPADALRPSERREVERCLNAARRHSHNWLPPLICLGILEIDYYEEHGMVSDNDVSIEDVAQKLAASPPSVEDLRFIRFLSASPQAMGALGIVLG